MGATYTPRAIVSAMTAWPSRKPARVVDPGAGSGRFIVSAGRAWPKAELVGVEIDPVAALLARAHVNTAGLGPERRWRIWEGAGKVAGHMASRSASSAAFGQLGDDLDEARAAHN